MTPGQEANGNNLENFFFYLLHTNAMLSILIRITLILISIHNIQFHDTMRNFQKYLFS